MRWILLFSLLSVTAQASGFDTNLGAEGNQWVAETFARYRASTVGCVPSNGAHRRILVQGFGPFSGISRNLSGAVSAELAGLKDLPVTQHGGWAQTRTSEVAGENIEFCFLYLDVIWDLAGSILLTEIERFQPELVMMSGSGSHVSIAEGGAVNQALGLSGFDAAGNPIRDLNTPWCESGPCGYSENTFVLSPQDAGVTSQVTHTWNNEAFARSLRTSLPDLEFEAPKEARESNDYLCNNVSFIVQSALNGAEIRLAGGLIRFKARPSPTKAGFFHYPYYGDPSADVIQSWASAIVRALQAQP